MEASESVGTSASGTAPRGMGWRETYLKEDWWAIWLGVGIVLVAWLFFVNGSTIRWIAVTPKKWSSLDQLAGDFAANLDRYAAQLVIWLAIFCVSLRAMGHKLGQFV